MELSRLLRRGLLVAAIAVAGWLLGTVFAGSASADELPGDRPQPREQPSGGLLGGLLGGITHSVTGLTDSVVDLTGSVVDTTSQLLTPVNPPVREPIADVPELLPIDDWTGSNGTDRVEQAPVPAPTPAPLPVAPAPQPVVVPTPVQVVAPAPVPAAAPAPQQAVAQEKTTTTTAAGHQTGTGSTPEPVKSPAGPSGPGSTVSAAHNDSGGARGTHGVLVSQATLSHPADAGFTTRSRAVNAAGRDTGLPVSTPD